MSSAKNLSAGSVDLRSFRFKVLRRVVVSTSRFGTRGTKSQRLAEILLRGIGFTSLYVLLARRIRAVTLKDISKQDGNSQESMSNAMGTKSQSMGRLWRSIDGILILEMVFAHLGRHDVALRLATLANLLLHGGSQNSRFRQIHRRFVSSMRIGELEESLDVLHQAATSGTQAKRRLIGPEALVLRHLDSATDSMDDWSRFVKDRDFLVVGPAQDVEIATAISGLERDTHIIWLGSLAPSFIDGTVIEDFGAPLSQTSLALNGENTRHLAQSGGLSSRAAYSWIVSKAAVPVGCSSPTRQHVLSSSVNLLFQIGTPNLLHCVLFDLIQRKCNSIFVAGVNFYTSAKTYRQQSDYVAPSLLNIGPSGIHAADAMRRSLRFSLGQHYALENFSTAKMLQDLGLVEFSGLGKHVLGMGSRNYSQVVTDLLLPESP